MKKFGKRFTSLLLVAVLLLTSVIGTNRVYAEGEEEDEQLLTWEVVENNPEKAAGKFNKAEQTENPATALKGNVRVSIVLEGKSTMDVGYSTQAISLDPAAISYRESLKETQDDISAVIKRDVLDGEDLDVVWNLTLAANIISANVPAEKIDEIKAIDGVKDVVVELQYYPNTDEVSADDPNMSVATGMTGTSYAWAAGYTGAGSKVAIVDTGLDIDHQSFNAEAFEEAIKTDEMHSGIEYDLMEEKDVKKFWSMLNASQRAQGDGSEAYLNSKVPYRFNYVDSNYDVTHLNDTQGEHGSHVAGIAAANKYILNEDKGVQDAIDAVRTHGNAPDAQLLVMKVFGKGGGAFDSDYFAAIEDAIVLGADSVNLSLGSSVAGLTYNPTYKNIIDGMTNVNLIWANSAGNNSYWAEQTSFRYLYADGANFATGGSPATYANTLSVASVDNDGFTGATLQFGDQKFYFTETYGYGNSPLTTIADTYDFVYVDAPGTEADFAQVADLLEGKIAMCNRGSSSFFEKANAAVSNGAIATIIVNNQSGTISMNLTGYLYSAPCVSITLAEGQMIKNGSDENETDDGLTYYTGTITINKEIRTDVYDSDFYTMSSFSSWGVPGDLSLKPEITAPGGNIYSVFGTNKSQTGLITGGVDQYENMSGTSMAAPQMAGIAAVMAQYVKENGLDEQANRLGITRRALIQSLLMSTATPLFDGESYNYYPVIQQGAGLVDVEAAINSNIVVLMDSTAVNGEARKDISSYAKDGKVKAELGDDPDRTGRYTVEFTLNNISDHELAYDLNADFFTQDVGAFYQMSYGIEDEFIDTWTTGLYPNLTWYVNDARYEEDVVYDFDGNPDVFDDNDAMAILNAVVAGDVSELPEEADLNDDGVIDTYDAYLALRMANEAAAIVPAQGKTSIRVEIEFDEDEFETLDNNGAYIEGYIFAQERDSEDGEIGVLHSIPVLGYYGNWSEPSSLDVGSLLEYQYGLEERIPYMYAALEDDVTTTSGGQFFIYYDAALDGNFVLGGNPLESYLADVIEDYAPVYYPERNAFNGNNTLVAMQYSLIRNAAAARFDLTDEEGNVIEDSVVTEGSNYAAYYYPGQGQWQGTLTSSNYGYTPSDLAEGSNVVLRFSVAPEYFYDENHNIVWDDVIPDKTLPLVIDNTAPVFDSLFASRITQTKEEMDDEGNIITVNEDGVLITIDVYDNEYLAGLFVYDENDELWFAQGPRAEDKPAALDTQEYILTYDASMPDHLYAEAYDYAGNLTTVQINLNKEELNDPIEVTLDQEYVQSAVGATIKLNATVTPWGSKNQAVTWTSSDESVATVNENGVVRGVGEGFAVVTATSVADPDKSADCYFEFILVEEELNAVIWDEDGAVWFTQFNTATLPDFERLSPSMRMAINATTYAEDGNFYITTLDTDNFVSTLYTVDEDTYEVSEVGPSQIGYMDICPAPSLSTDEQGMLLGVYGTYVILINRETGDFEGFFDLAQFTGNAKLVGIAYEEQYDHPNYGMTDWVFLIDQQGVVYNTGFLPYGDSYSRFSVSTLGKIGAAVDISYWQSLYYDSTNLYWSRFNYSSNKVDLIMVNDIYHDGSIYTLGSFNSSVWPVAGLYDENLKEMIGLESASSRHAEALIDQSAVFETELAPVSYAPAAAGKLNSISAPASKGREDVKVAVDPANEDPDVAVVLITSDGTVVGDDGVSVTHNGLFEVEYDPDVLELAEVVPFVRYYAASDVLGQFRFGFMDLNGVATDEVIAKIVFNRLSDEPSNITVTEIEKDNGAEVSEPIDYTVEDSEYYDWGDILPEDRPATIEEVPEGIWISALSDVVYNGAAQKQDFRVYDGRKMLKEGTDYSVTYQNNKNAGTATVKVTGKGNYKDAKTKTFEILPVEISNDSTVIILDRNALPFNTNKRKANVDSVYCNGVKLSKGRDFTVTYSNPNSLEIGTYTITITGKGNYAGVADTTYQIISEDVKPVSSLGVSGIKNVEYTGQPVYQDVVVKDSGNVLRLGVDYALEYRDNVEVGFAFVTVSGLKDSYAGSVTKVFKIMPVKLSANNTAVEGLPTSVKYNGVVAPQIRVLLGNNELVEGEDYTSAFKNNDKVGTATLQIKGVGNYAGSFNKTFKITAIDLSNAEDIAVAQLPPQPYEKGGNKPDVEVFDKYNGVELVSGKDYTLSYKNNSKQGLATVTVKGKGNYTGSVSLDFSIVSADLSSLKATAADKKFANSKNNFKSNIEIYDVNGKKLSAGTDYDKNVVYTANGQVIENNAIVPAGTLVTVTAQGKGNYTGSVSAQFRVVAANISSASVKVADQIYTGKEVEVDKAEITVKMSGNVLSPEDFEIVGYQNNVNKGTAKITIQGVGNYGGTKTVSFKIVQKSFLNAIWSFFR